MKFIFFHQLYEIIHSKYAFYTSVALPKTSVDSQNPSKLPEVEKNHPGRDRVFSLKILDKSVMTKKQKAAV